MDFASVILFMILYYLRPQEWIGGLAAFRPVTVVMAMAIAAMFMRYRGFSVRDFFRTSHDWLMLAYFLWIVVASPAPFNTFKQVYTLFLFYVVTVQTLSNWERLRTFLNWWTVLIFAVAALAVASEYGFDPMESYDVTHGPMKNRLVLNTSIFNNPNALGHSVYPVTLMLYFLAVWKRPLLVKALSIPLFILPLYCLYLSASKGAFLAGFAAAVGAMVFGRPKTIQILVLVLACTAGWAGLKTLPRMGEMQKAQADTGVQGRLAAFDYGLSTMRAVPKGIGYDRFQAGFFDAHHYSKASHSTYVQVGAELGYLGLFLYLAILYGCLRTLLIARTANVDEERVRRILFVLLISYLASGWMVNFTYRATFFLMAGAIAAFHRQLFDRTAMQTEPAAEAIPDLQPVTIAPGLAMSTMGHPAVVVPLPGAGPVVDLPAEPAGLRWRRFKWLDWALVLVLTYATIRFWIYIMNYL